MSGKKKVTPFEYVCALIVLERFQPDTVLSSVWASPTRTEMLGARELFDHGATSPQYS
jgi:hypothetical protein